MNGFLKLSTAVNITVLMIDSADHITGKTGLTLTIYATKAAGSPASISPTVTELDSTNVKGLYKLALTSSHTDTLGELQLHVTSSGADPADYAWQVSTYLPGEAATLQADQAVNVTKVNGTSQTARDLGASVLLSAGTGTGQLDFTSGVVKANLAQILGTALTETAGQIAAAFKQFFDVASPTGTMKAITNVVTTTTATNLTNAPTAGDFTSTMKTSLNAATPAVTVSDKTGFSLSSAGVQAIWDALTSALTTVGSIGKLLVDNINATISSRASQTSVDTIDDYIDTEVAAIKAKTDNLPSDPADASDIAGAFTTVNTKLDTIDDYIDTEVAAIKAKTDLIPAAPAAVSDIPTATQNADALLKRDMSAVTGEASRSPLNALRFIRNKFSTTVTPGSVTVYKEDDVTEAYTKSLTTDPAAEPIVEG